MENLDGRLILTVEVTTKKLLKTTDQNIFKQICPIFRFATQTFLRGCTEKSVKHKRDMNLGAAYVTQLERLVKLIQSTKLKHYILLV